MSPRRVIEPPAWGGEQLRTEPDTPIERRGIIVRPLPPAECDEDRPETFVPDSSFATWMRETFLAGSGPLANEDHEHLMDASIGVLWTNAINETKQRRVVATAEIPNAMAGGWRRSRYEFQLREWFGALPDFLLTFSAPDCARMSHREFCAVVEHELYHCAQAFDRYGAPKFHRETGAPMYAIRSHDVEEFIGVVRRYGPTSKDVRDLVKAASQRPVFDGDQALTIACGTCA